MYFPKIDNFLTANCEHFITFVVCCLVVHFFIVVSYRRTLITYQTHQNQLAGANIHRLAYTQATQT